MLAKQPDPDRYHHLKTLCDEYDQAFRHARNTLFWGAGFRFDLGEYVRELESVVTIASSRVLDIQADLDRIHGDNDVADFRVVPIDWETDLRLGDRTSYQLSDGLRLLAAGSIRSAINWTTGLLIEACVDRACIWQEDYERLLQQLQDVMQDRQKMHSIEDYILDGYEHILTLKGVFDKRY